MTDDNLPTPPDGSSPFDALRHVRPDGSEYWSSRELMPYYEYTRWENFSPVILRAIQTAENVGVDIGANFLFAQEVSGQRGPKREDVQLSRFGAYLVAMNGDPSKPMVAAMQAYFAVQTRVAETMPQPLTGEELISAALIEAHKVLEIRLRRIAELEPKAKIFDEVIDSDGTYEWAAAAAELGWTRNLMLIELRAQKILKSHPKSVKNVPYAEYEHYFFVEPQTWDHPDTGEKIPSRTTRVKRSSIPWLHERLTTYLGYRPPTRRGG